MPPLWGFGRKVLRSQRPVLSFCEAGILPVYSFDFDLVKNANTAAERRPITMMGRLFRFAAALSPSYPFIKAGQPERCRRDTPVSGCSAIAIFEWGDVFGAQTDVYTLPVLSAKTKPKSGAVWQPSERITDEQRALLVENINADLKLLEESTGFDCSKCVHSMMIH